MCFCVNFRVCIGEKGTIPFRSTAAAFTFSVFLLPLKIKLHNKRWKERKKNAKRNHNFSIFDGASAKFV